MNPTFLKSLLNIEYLTNTERQNLNVQKNLKRFKKIAMNCNVWKHYDLKQKILQKLFKKNNDRSEWWKRKK